MIILQFLIMAAAIFTGFRALNFLLNKLTVIPMRRRKHLGYVIPVIELAAWIAVLLWIAKAIYETRNYLALLFVVILFVLLSGPLFFLIRNFIAGIILRLQNKIVAGMYIDIEGTRGVVKKAGHLGLEIEDLQLNISYMPYHALRSKRIIRQGSNPSLEKATIRFELKYRGRTDELGLQLKREVLNTPWVAVSHPPVIENVITENDMIIIDLGVFMLDRSYADKVRLDVMSAFSV